MRNLAVRYCAFLDRQGATFHLVVGLLCIGLLAAADYYSDLYFGFDYTLLLFYLLPVAFVAWFAGRIPAMIMALICVATKVTIQFSSPEPLSLLIWRNGSALVFFLVIGMILARMRQLLNHERSLSGIDHLTGAASRRVFLEVTTNEIFRLRRHYHPFTIAYLDLDNFKGINDAHGHKTGDFLLQTVVTTISHNLRRTDVVARLGGDEFAILLPDTADAAAFVAIHKIRKELLESMERHRLPVTFSIGVLTCTVAPQSVDEITALADNLMYDVKKSGKNGLRHAAYAHGDLPAPVPA